jgi:hypothetical protein
VLASSRGLELVAELSSSGTVIGTLIPAVILVALGIAYLIQGTHSAAPINAHHVLRAWTGLASIVLVVNSFFTYAGVEVNPAAQERERELSGGSAIDAEVPRWVGAL